MVWADKGRGLKLIEECPFCLHDSDKEGGVFERVGGGRDPYECGCGRNCSIINLYNRIGHVERSKANLTYVE